MRKHKYTGLFKSADEPTYQLEVKVVTAKYLDDYKIEIIFNDKKRNVIDFLPALKKYATCKKYLDITLFKKFKVDSGNIVWGNNWEMIFKIEDLYENKFN